MAVQLFIVIAVALTASLVNGQDDLIRVPVLTGAEERALQLEQNPELLALAAETLSRVLIVIEGPQQTVVLVEGVNAHIDCYPWLINFPGGTTRWLFQQRSLEGEPVGGEYNNFWRLFL